MTDEPNKIKTAKKGRSRKIPNKKGKGKVIKTQSVTALPESQSPLPIPCDDKTAKGVSKVIQLSFLDYMQQLEKEGIKDTHRSLAHLSNILQEFLGPYMLVGYLPDGSPVEMFSAKTIADQEAMHERIRRVVTRTMGGNI